MLRAISLSCGLVLLGLAACPASTEAHGEPVTVQHYFQNLDYGTYSQLLEQYQAFSLQGQPGANQEINPDIYGTQSKSVKRAFFYSLLLPGAGQYYGESKLKAAAFVGLEALFWVGYFHYDGKGDDKKVEYRTLADANWNANVYRDSMMHEYYEAGYDYVYGTDTLDFLDYTNNPSLYSSMRADEQVIYNMEESLRTVSRTDPDFGFTHHSVGISDQEYYENIGKYNQFSWGWGGYQGNPITAIRNAYLDMRHDANSFYDKAKWSVVASLGNHILSAIDAALTVKRFNRKQDRFSEASLKFRMVPEAEGISPRAVLTVKFR